MALELCFRKLPCCIYNYSLLLEGFQAYGSRDSISVSLCLSNRLGAETFETLNMWLKINYSPNLT